ncbi:MAG: 5'-methylthioadenosine/adenosylhomocysteine nucleosidase [Erysipelotrichales bacterium]|nr:5'-methylthioadenosine/adenosylhomocysteine nucleosidase [Erysipelotrichales bacterium]
MITGIICAMISELKGLTDQQKIIKEEVIAGRTFYHLEINETQVVCVVSGIGKVNATITATILIERYAPERIISIGVAGGTEKTKKGDLVIGIRLCYHDFDLRHFNHTFGSVPGRTLYFESDESMIVQARNAAKKMKINFLEGLITSGDAFINSYEQIKLARENFEPIFAVEMESTAIAQACIDYQIPFLALRFVSDIIEEANQEKNYSDFEKKCNVIIKNLLWQMI